MSVSGRVGAGAVHVYRLCVGIFAGNDAPNWRTLAHQRPQHELSWCATLSHGRSNTTFPCLIATGHSLCKTPFSRPHLPIKKNRMFMEIAQ